MNELISVIIPVYNTEKFLEKCVQSILNQTYKNIEIILINDGSTDGSGLLCDKLKETDDRIKVIHKKNGGAADARNEGLKVIKGQYISFIDSDDYIDENMYNYMLKNMKGNSAEIGICGWYLVRGDEVSNCKFQSAKKVLTTEQCIDYLLRNNSFDSFMCNKIFKKELFDNICFPVGNKLEDLAILYEVINGAKRVFMESIPFYYYVLREASTTSKLNSQIDVKIFNEYIIRKDKLLAMYPNLKNRILSNYFTACRMNLIVALKSPKREIAFEKDRIKDMKKNWMYVWFDDSIGFRSKVSFSLSTINPYLFFKLRFRNEIH